MSDYALHIASWYPNHKAPNEGDFIKKQIEELSKLYKTIVIAVVEHEGERKLVRKNNLNFEEHILYIPIKPWKHFNYIRSLWGLFHQITKQHGLPKFIHVHVMFRAVFVAWLANQRFKVPYLITEHFTAFTPESLHPRKKEIIRFSKLFSKRAKCIIAISNYLAKSLTTVGFKNVVTIPNIIDTSLFTYRQRKLQDPIKLLHISNLKEDQKNVSGILRTFNSLKNELQVSLTVVGSNRQKLLTYREQYYNHNKDQSIKFLDAVSQVELAKVMDEHDVLVMFSNYETFSLVIGEAIANGLYIIATNIGGPKELVLNEDVGILVEPRNEEQLKEAIRKVVATKKVPMRAASAEIDKKYGMERFLISMEKVYKNIC